jgi:hypothetical protein
MSGTLKKSGPFYICATKKLIIMRQFTLAIALVAILISSCGPSIYKSNQFSDVAAKHKIVAILPAHVTVQLRPNEMKKTTPEQLQQTEETTGYDFQDKLYSWFLRRSDKYHYTVKFQDISKTNALLKNANISYKDLQTKPKEELARILGVDAVISESIRTDKPMSECAAVAVGAVFGYWGSTNKATTSINIHEAKAGDLIWKYDYEASGSVGSSPDNLVNAIMRNASKKFPYNAK